MYTRKIILCIILEAFTGVFYIKIMRFTDFLQGSRNVSIPRMDLDMEKIREIYVLQLYQSYSCAMFHQFFTSIASQD